MKIKARVILLALLAIGLLGYGQFAVAKDGLKVATPALPQSLINPYRTIAPPSIYVTAAVFDALTRFDHDGQLQPWLATSWRRDGALAWIFDLRQGVQFSNGEAFNADAVVSVVKFLTSPEGVVEGVYREMPFLDRAETISEHQVRIVTKTPVPSLPRFMVAMPIVAPKQWARLGVAGFAREPVGTGPFQLERWKTNALQFKAFAKSWRRPKEDTLEFTVVPIPTTRVSGLLSNVFNIALDLGPDDIGTLEEAGHKGVVTLTSSVSGISFFLTRPSPFSDIRVRRAVNMAVNREAIIASLLNGTTRASSQPVTPLALGYNADVPVYPYDPDQARALLREAGHEKGFKFSYETTIGYAPNDAAIFQQIAQDLRAVGIQMDIITVPITEFLTRRGNGAIQSEAFAVEWPAWPTLDGLRAVRTHSCLREPVPWFCDRELSSLIEAAFLEENDAKSLRMRQDIMRRYHEAAPALFLFEAPQFSGMRAEVQGYREDTNLINYSEITVGEGRGSSRR